MVKMVKLQLHLRPEMVELQLHWLEMVELQLH